MKNRNAIEKLTGLQTRAKELKKVLLQYLAKSKKKAVIVGYDQILKALSATCFLPDGTPVNYA